MRHHRRRRPGAGQVGGPAILTRGLHGNGFLNSGILTDPGAPGSDTFTVRFTQPGAYLYGCLIHAGMSGQITVTP
jgi:hypothetical protein